MVAYTTAHELMGKASEQTCLCGKPAQHWAYQHTGEVLYSPKGTAYSENPEDYIAMCRKCHRQFDLKTTPERFEAIAAAASKWKKDNPEDTSRIATAAARALWEKNPEAARVGQLLGSQRIKNRWKTDPEFAARRTAEMNAAANTKRRKCAECDLTTTAGALANHQKHSKHQGMEEL